jgi:hypothetical protein
MKRLALVGTSLLLATTTLVAVVEGGQITREEALAAVFPDAAFAVERVFLTQPQMARIGELAGVEVESGLVARYIATRDGQTAGRAYVDTHVVRTKRESLLISLEADGRVKRIDVTAFLEPTEYRAHERWLQQYDQRGLTDDLAVQRAIRPMAGATLTAGATNAAVRRVLAIDQVLERADREVGAVTR